MRLAITDLETEGLNPLEHHVLEVHVRTVEAETLLEVAGGAFHAYVGGCDPGRMDAVVRQMHTDNGLLARLLPPPRLPGIQPPVWARAVGIEYAADSPPSPIQVGLLLELYLTRLQVNGDRKSLMLTGNSLGMLDVPFLKAWMPMALNAVHYRTLDVSAVRTFYREVLQLELPPHLEDLVSGKAESTHRAADDTLTCLRSMRLMRAWDECRTAVSGRPVTLHPEAHGWLSDWTHPTDTRGSL